ncbi:MAG: GNAT family N-acetyltransferase [Phycisphaerales bacterium]
MGILPMFVERRWLGPVWLKVAALVGSDYSYVLDPPMREAGAREMYIAAMKHLLGELGCDAVKLSPLSGTYARTAALREAAGSLGETARVLRDEEIGPHTMLYLPATFEEYLASLSRSVRSNHKRRTKLLAEGYEVKVDVISEHTELAAEFPKFVALHGAQWNAEGKLGHFDDWPGAEAYYCDLIKKHAPQGRARIVRLALNGEVASYQLCFAFDKCLHWVLPARSTRPELERFSLGTLGVMQLAEGAIRDGYAVMEQGVGHYGYKLDLGGTEHAVRAVVVGSSSLATRLRVKCFLWLAKRLDFFYYRVWFQRVAPKLPLARRPLWTTWIRSRL